MAVKLGTEVTDSVTGFKGVAMSRTEFLHGCVKIEIQPKKLIDGKMAEAGYLDEVQLKENDPKTTKPKNTLLGQLLTDSISGFQGVGVAYTEYLHASPRISLQPKAMREGKPLDGYMFDVPQLKEYQSPITEVPIPKVKKTGGPRKMASPNRMAPR